MVSLRAIAAAISCAGTATLQARQLLITQTAAPFGESALTQATSGLATAYSLGSVVEFFLSPSFGRLSDRFGRKPVMLFLMIGPALMRALCAVVKEPFFRIRLLTLFWSLACSLLPNAVFKNRKPFLVIVISGRDWLFCAGLYRLFSTLFLPMGLLQELAQIDAW